MPEAEQGLMTSKRYQFIPRVLIFLTSGDKILLLKGAPNKGIWPNLFNGLGGHVERGETVLQAAQREVLEESGLVVNNLWLCANVSIDGRTAIGGGCLLDARHHVTLVRSGESLPVRLYGKVS